MKTSDDGLRRAVARHIAPLIGRGPYPRAEAPRGTGRRPADGRLALDAWALGVKLRAWAEQGERRPRPRTTLVPMEAPAVVGGSPALTTVLEAAARMAPAAEPVLLGGEHGSGKELLARWLHARSGRPGPFLARGCGTLTDSLLESELFGHRRGAFTGAVQDHVGLFEQAHRGSLLLDDVENMSASLQASLLRVLQDGVVVPLGAVEGRRVDVRLFAASHTDLEVLVRTGRFRADLFYRINGLRLSLAPLRERGGDIPALVEHFLAQAVRRAGGRSTPALQPGLLEALQRWPWPGNVRELRNEVERLVVLSEGARTLGAEGLSERLRSAVAGVSGGGAEQGARQPASPAGARQRDARPPLAAEIEALERERIAEALAAHAGNRSRVALELGVSRRNLLRKIARYGLGERGRSGPGAGTEKS